jgi:hypothetical protein
MSTGYIINPFVKQVFTSGPNSGSLVENYEYELNDITSSLLLCTESFHYKEYRPDICDVSGSNICISPIIITGSYISGNEFNITYNLYNNTSSIMEYSLYKFGSIYESRSIELIDNNNQIIDVSDLNPQPINNSFVFFRIKNECNNELQVSYTFILIKSVPIINTYYLIILKRGINQNQVCSLSYNYSLAYICDNNGWCGSVYYINSINLIDATTLTLNNTGTILAEPGWYGDGVVSRYWNGDSFINSIYC